LHSPGLDAVGLEQDARGVEIAREHYPHLRFLRGSVERDPAEIRGLDAPFDAVVSAEVIELLCFPADSSRSRIRCYGAAAPGAGDAVSRLDKMA